MIRLVTAALASSARAPWADSTPTNLPVNVDCHSRKVKMARATSARYAATLRPCSAAFASGSYVGLWSKAASGGAPA
eukprot:10496390-Alexandrium_andersonii.AAC.1